MSLFNRYDSKSKLWEHHGELEDKVEKLEARLHALSNYLSVAYLDGRFGDVEAVSVVPKDKK